MCHTELRNVYIVPAMVKAMFHISRDGTVGVIAKQLRN